MIRASTIRLVATREITERLRGRATWIQVGITTLLVEQNVKAVSHIADRGYFLEKGRVVATGSPAELLTWSNGSRLVS